MLNTPHYQISQIDLLVTMQKNLGIISDEMRRTAFDLNSQVK